MTKRDAGILLINTAQIGMNTNKGIIVISMKLLRFEVALPLLKCICKTYLSLTHSNYKLHELILSYIVQNIWENIGKW